MEPKPGWVKAMLIITYPPDRYVSAEDIEADAAALVHTDWKDSVSWLIRKGGCCTSSGLEIAVHFEPAG
jgi:hypothetical protein